jgi:hypothetical protein
MPGTGLNIYYPLAPNALRLTFLVEMKLFNSVNNIPIAKKKSERRGIPEEWIAETLTFPSQTVEGYGGRKVAHKTYGIENKEYLLRVVYEEKEDVNIVLTAYMTSQVTRYWKEEKDAN